ncbi:MAG: hypothetical protein RLO50_14440 [Azospirillaceae bacterium]
MKVHLTVDPVSEERAAKFGEWAHLVGFELDQLRVIDWAGPFYQLPPDEASSALVGFLEERSAAFERVGSKNLSGRVLTRGPNEQQTDYLLMRLLLQAMPVETLAGKRLAWTTFRRLMCRHGYNDPSELPGDDAPDTAFLFLSSGANYMALIGNLLAQYEAAFLVVNGSEPSASQCARDLGVDRTRIPDWRASSWDRHTGMNSAQRKRRRRLDGVRARGDCRTDAEIAAGDEDHLEMMRRRFVAVHRAVRPGGRGKV